MCEVSELLLFILLGYLSGSVLYSPLIARVFQVDIVRESDDHNPGGANVFKLVGPAAGVLAVACDIVKAFAPVYLARLCLDPARLSFALVMVAPVMGHAFPVFSGFKGGKAIAAAFGVTLGLFPNVQPFAVLACLYLFFSLVLIVRPNLFRSQVTFALFSLYGLMRVPLPGLGLGLALCGGVVILRHALAWRGEKFRVALLRLPPDDDQNAHPAA